MEREDVIELKEPLRMDIEEKTREFLKNGGKIEEHPIYIRPLDVNIKSLPSWEQPTVSKFHLRATELGKKIMTLWDEGVTAKAISERLGIHLNTVYKHTRGTKRGEKCPQKK